MMLHNDDLRLSLSLSSECPNTTTAARFTRSLHHPHPLHFNLISSSSSSTSSSPSLFLPNLTFSSLLPPNTSFASSDRDSEAPSRSAVAAGEPKSCLKGIDANRSSGEEDEAGVSSPISTISSISGKRSEREATVGAGDDHEADEEEGETSRKKLRLSKDQSAVLEESFKEHSTLNPKQKLALANRLGLRTRQVEVWFQNRRARTKLKQTEVDCEFLKRCCEQLTEENKRLQKEVQELRALKMSPQFYMKMKPPTTLSMCAACERVGTTAPTADGDVRRLPWGL